MCSLVNPTKLALLVALMLSLSASRVCYATVANFTQNTAIGLCSQAVLQVLKVGTNGTVTYVTSATQTTTTVRNLLPTFCNRRVAYPYLEPYLAVVGAGTEAPLATMLASATIRGNFIKALVALVKTYPRCVGIMIDFSGLSTSQATAYSTFMAALLTAAQANSILLASALPWDASRYADVYFNPTLPKLAFNVLRTFEDFFQSSTSIIHPLNPLFAMAAPFNNPANTIALLFSTQFGVQTNNAGESITSSSSLTYVFNSFGAIDIKLNFARTNSLGGVALFSLNTAGANAELLRYITSIIAPTPPTGYTYPVATAPTCG
uniref:GH18 domain-containing protein n=1 Tax=Anopheles maculatus TaxID=74869 RepID=A0A182T5R6_9DIPT